MACNPEVYSKAKRCGTGLCKVFNFVLHIIKTQSQPILKFRLPILKYNKIGKSGLDPVKLNSQICFFFPQTLGHSRRKVWSISEWVKERDRQTDWLSVALWRLGPNDAFCEKPKHPASRRATLVPGFSQGSPEMAHGDHCLQHSLAETGMLLPHRQSHFSTHTAFNRQNYYLKISQWAPCQSHTNDKHVLQKRCQESTVL